MVDISIIWWEAPESMIQELWGVEIDAEKVDTNVPEWVKEDVGTAEAGLSWDIKHHKVWVSSLDKPPLKELEEIGAVGSDSEDVDATVCDNGHLLYRY